MFYIERINIGPDILRINGGEVLVSLRKVGYCNCSNVYTVKDKKVSL